MSEENQYKAPSSNVEQSSAQEYGPVRFFAVSGRLGRIRYLAYSLGIGVAFMVVIMLSSFLITMGGSSGGIMSIVGGGLMAISYLVVFVISIMLTIQRAHDFNSSGWLSLVYFIPLVSLIFLFIPGTDGSNQYGLKTPPNNGGAVVIIVMFVLIFVIGILAAIAIPAYQAYVEQAKQMQMEQTR